MRSFLFRDDSYTFNSIEGNPTVKVDLIWPEGPNPSNGRLLVSNASGEVLYFIPLGEIEGINAILPIPKADGGTSNLDISLQINEPDEISTSGSYRISIYWAQTNANAPSLVATPQSQNSATPLAAGASLASGSSLALGSSLTNAVPSAFGTPSCTTPVNTIAGPPAPQPTLTFTKDLPTPIPSPSAPPGGSLGGNGSGSPVIALSDPSLSKAVVIPTAPTMVSSSASSSGAPLTAQPSYEVPLPPSSGSSSLGSEGGRPAVIGPLPLSTSSPDGGVFAYGPSKGAGDPFRATLTTAASPDALDGPDALGGSSRLRLRGYAVPVPWEGPGIGLPIGRPDPMELAGSPSSTGAAFLPAFLPVAQARLSRDSHRTAASRWPILYARIKPRTSLAALGFGVTGLFFGLVAPDSLTMLAAWKEDRRWKRQLVLVDPKKPVSNT